MQVGDLRSDDIYNAQDAAQVLLELLEERDGGREAAVPAAVVALDALPALRLLGAQLPTKEPVQQLLSFCCIAREAVRLHFLTSTLVNACSRSVQMAKSLSQRLCLQDTSGVVALHATAAYTAVRNG